MSIRNPEKCCNTGCQQSTVWWKETTSILTSQLHHFDKNQCHWKLHKCNKCLLTLSFLWNRSNAFTKFSFYFPSIFICRRNMLYSYQINFLGITPANWNWLDRNFAGRHGVMWHAALQTFGASAKRVQMAPKKRILQTFCQQNNTSFHPLPNGQFLWNLNAKHESVLSWNFWNRISKFFQKRPFSPKSLWTLHLIAEGPVVTFFVQLTIFEI